MKRKYEDDPLVNEMRGLIEASKDRKKAKMLREAAEIDRQLEDKAEAIKQRNLTERLMEKAEANQKKVVQSKSGRRDPIDQRKLGWSELR